MTDKATAQMGGLTRDDWNEAIEAAARECGICASRQAAKHDQKVRDQTRRDLATAIRALKREPNAGWVPVSERLPEQGSTVLIFLISDEGTNIADIANQNDDERGFFIRGTFWEWKYATHWMPLPPPPERP